MNFYILAATAIPALWVGCGLLRPAPADVSFREALERTVLRAVLAAGELSAVTIVAVGHEGYLGASLSALALILGTLVVLAKSAVGDLRRLHVTWLPVLVVGGLLALLVFGYAAKR